MCGISGIWNYRTLRPADPEAVQRITRLLIHRGPDGEGYYTLGAIGLGHRRLSIIDLAGGHQPMCNETGDVWISFNGEIYNYSELRASLQRKGHIFRTNSDTETIIHLYEQLGESCFEKLRGMFAVAIWDERQQQLLLARDRLGIKPLFYGFGEDGIVFGSEIKCVQLSEQVDTSIDITAIADLFALFYIPGPKTIYKNIRSLDPGTYLRVDRQGGRQLAYWDLKDNALDLSSEQEYSRRLHTILHDSVKSHLVSDVPVGAFLSGGADSSAVVSLMSSLVPQAVKTCTIGFNEEEYNELTRARIIADRFRTDHQEQTITPEPARILEKLVQHYDQPFADHSSIPTFYVSQLARKRVKVVLSGDGGDETFLGYSRYRRQLVLQRMRRSVPARFLAHFGSRTGDRFSGNLAERLGRVLHQSSLGARDGYLHGITVGDERLRSRILLADLKRELKGYDPLDQFRDIYDRAPGRDVLSKISYLDIKTYLVDDVLTKVDRASMANSLEVRVPLLDHKVVEFAWALPLDMKIREGKGKHLLRQTLNHAFPPEFINAPKKGFRIPVVPWLMGPLREWAEEAIFNGSPDDQFLDATGKRSVWSAFQNGRGHLGDFVSILLAFGLWSKHKRESKEWQPFISQQALPEASTETQGITT